MASTYAEYLKAQGATDDEIKVLDVPSARKVYDALTAQATQLESRATKAESDKAAYDKWYKEVAEPTAAKALAERDQAVIESAAANAQIKKAQELGLLKIMEQMEGGGGDDAAKKAAAASSSQPDMSKYVDREQFLQATRYYADGATMIADIADEHRRLGIDKPVNFRLLKQRADENKRSLDDQWQSDFDIPNLRAQRATAEKTAYETKLREEGASSERAKLQTVNPHLVSPSTSTSPFTGKPPSAQDAVMPWQKTDAEREQARLQKGLSKLAVQ